MQHTRFDRRRKEEGKGKGTPFTSEGGFVEEKKNFKLKV